MSLKMEDLLMNQSQVVTAMKQLLVNFKKAGQERRSSDYIKRRVENLDAYWQEFHRNHITLSEFEDQSHEYFFLNHYQQAKEFYISTRETFLQSIEIPLIRPATPLAGTSSAGFEVKSREDTEMRSSVELPKLRSQSTDSKLDELLKKQGINFKAFSRTISNINIESITEMWEFEDTLKRLEARWSVIDSLHWELEGELDGKDDSYDETFSAYETAYNKMKRSLNSKMWSVNHREKSTPKMDIPTFSGSFNQWVSFKDLFLESIHNNRSLSDAQKLQFLKNKLKGEAEKIIQHLHISSENYHICWSILNNRYNNVKLICNSHLHNLFSLPAIQQQSAAAIKKMFDTTNECLNAVKNLGADISGWDPIVVYLLSQKMDSQTYNEYTDSLKNPKELPKLSDFMKFLENKFTSLESSRRKPEVSKQDQSKTAQESFPKKHFYKNQNHKSFSNTSGTKNQQPWTQRCPLCKENHRLFNCNTFLESTPASKLETINKLHLCKNCLYEHKHKACFSEKRCKQCQENHNSLLHDSFNSNYNNAKPEASSSNNKNEVRKNVTHVSNENIIETLLATAQIKIKAANGSYQYMRALIDQGSQMSLISENAAQRLGLPRHACKGVIFGVGEKQNHCKGTIKIDASAMRDDFTFHGELFIMKSLIGNLPNQSFPKPSLDCLQNIQLADAEYNISRPVDVLLGADVYSLIIMSGIIKDSESQLVAQQTRLGWILCGNVRSYQCNVVLNNIDSIQRFWEIEDVSESKIEMSEEDNFCVQQYKTQTQRREDGRYVVKLPLKPNITEKLGESKQKAIAQFYHLEKKLSKNKNIQTNYQSFINEYINLGHMQESLNKHTLSCYLPHHCVIRSDSSTTALRVVFNASAKTTSGFSLNDLMYSGPNLQKDLFELILKWRKYEFVFTADLEKMFRQIFCHKEDIPYQKIIWRDSSDQALREYELLTVTYGTKAAPFLAMMTLKQLANDERANYPHAAKALEEEFYTDDLLSGHHSLQEAKELQKELIDLLRSGGFNLRKWTSNRSELLDDVSHSNKAFDFKHQESTKTLGLRWNPKEDQFTFLSKIDYTASSKSITKRILLSDISKIFDPLGWLSPVTTKLKLLFQTVWQLRLQWDDQVPEHISKQWSIITQDLQKIHSFKIPRWLETNRNANIELHGFCDSSIKAYACVIYCKIHKHNNSQHSSVVLVAGKTRLVPINKSITLPRLELSAALLLANLLSKVSQCLTGHSIKTFAWSDSTAVLGWLQGDPNRWKPFVANRVRQISEIIPTDSWRYVKSVENPADCASRGMSAEHLHQHSLWWHGPKWLSTFDESKNTEARPVYSTSEEIKQLLQINVAIQTQPDSVVNLISKYSSFTKATRVLAWILRAIRKSEHKPTYLTISELRKAKYIIIKHYQYSEFFEDIKNLQKQGQVESRSKLLNLNPYLDTDGLLRVGGRIRNARAHNNMKHPCIIPHNGHLTRLLIDQAHNMTYHGGARLTLSWLRQEYWIIGGTRAVKKRIRDCVTCRRHNPIKHTQMMADLPAARSNPSRPFHHTGVDYTGYVEVKSSKGRGIKTSKGYISIFVCMATKAVHFELVSDLSSASFLAALRRMAARRGSPSHIYSDNGTNFIGANRVLQEEYVQLQRILDKEFYTAITDMHIQWHFNAPSWPHAGGLWEAAVKSLKHHIKRVVGDQKLTYEEYSTILAQLEGCLNSRPLCALSDDPDDMDYLTPSHFLASGPTLTIIETERDTRTRWQLTQKIFDDIWKRWKTEYLCQLSARSKWYLKQPNLKIDDIVIVNDVNLPSGKWALGRIIDQHPGKDGLTRVVSVKTKNGIIKRPITKLSLLPVTENESLKQDNMVQNQVTTENDTLSSNVASNNKTFNRKGRKLNAFDVIYFALIFFMLIMTPSKCAFQTSSISINQSIYFDKIANVRLERDEWNLIVYYNMQPYWQGFDLLKKYVNHLDSICSKTTKVPQCDVILTQLRHGCTELDHYNGMLLDQHFSDSVRRKRGLINGIGNIARSLFGVLDEEFAQQYQKDIELIRSNQKHMTSLWKNQTSVVEAENNIIKRVENTMDRHHKLFNQHLNSLEKGVNTLKEEIQDSIIINSFSISSIIANNVLTNLRSIQETLVDTIMNIHDRRFNIHLLTPEQLNRELNIITGQLSKDLTLPIDNIPLEFSKIYHLLKVKARIMKKFIIFEVKIPLVCRDTYDLYNVLSIPRQVGKNMIRIIPTAGHAAINIRKDFYIPMTESDVQNCVQYDTETQICPLKRPIYQMTADEDFCVKEQHTNRCKTESMICTNTWTELNKLNTYLYICCGQCTVRVICGYQVTTEQLNKAGIITLSNECVIKGGTYTIYSHKKLSNSLNTEADVMNIDIPPINNIINLSIPITSIDNLTDHDHIERQNQIKQVENLLEQIKSQGELADTISYHDVHHYSVIYMVLGAAGVAAAVYACRRVRRARSATLTARQDDHQLQGAISVQSIQCISEQSGAISARTQNKATSPVFRKTLFSDE